MIKINNEREARESLISLRNIRQKLNYVRYIVREGNHLLKSVKKKNGKPENPASR